ncbi:cell division protein SepF [Candidatus Pacearchaeota archaeon]|nr:cell division protein SepF [Candidatus Pacearchaeota archaeon]
MVLNLKKIFGKGSTEEYVEIDLNAVPNKDTKVLVKPFVLRQYDDINDILNAVREGFTIAVVDIKTLKTKDVIELKRAVSKIKKTVDAIEGSIAGFGENVLIVTPKFAEIHRAPSAKPQKVDFINE